MRASKNNTIEKFRVVRKALEEIDVSSSDRLLSNSIFLNVVKYFLNKDIRESFAVTKELKEQGNLGNEERKVLNTKIREMFVITKAIKNIQTHLYDGIESVEMELINAQTKIETNNSGLVENNVLSK
tara:strand:- start:121 stop:501 length:381 start_codon:yes stop_codon:yes gene_type:complete